MAQVKTGIDEKELRIAVAKLRSLGKQFPVKERRKVLRKAAKPLVKAARANIPTSSKEHYVYKTPKISGKLKAPKGQGVKTKTYHPGNLRKSIRIKTFRKSPDVFVGAKTSKKRTGDFGKGNSVDGFYAHWMEFGNKNMPGIGYMRRAVDSTRTIVTNKIIEEFTKIFNSHLRKNAI